MAIEIERKFLVVDNSWKKLVCNKRKIKQGYLVKNIDKTIRIRLSDNQAFITIKTKKVNLSCGEFEYEIPLKDGKQLLKMCGSHIIEKTRNEVYDADGMLWEVDVFEGLNKGLVIAEVELKKATQKITLPEWVGKEVSHDKRYTNAYISAHKVIKD